MKNRLTFTDIIGVLLDNKKKTYPQYRMIHDMFSLYFGEHTIESRDLSIDNSILYSRWCNGARPIPIEIIRTYDDDERWDKMRNDFNKKILPNLINEPNARSQAEMLIDQSVDMIGTTMANELKNTTDNATFFTALIRYAILNDHSQKNLFSPELCDKLLSGRTPSCAKEFIGRKKELSEAATLLKNNSLLFITGIAGIGKSEFAKQYAKKNEKKYTNIIYIYYTGNLKKCIAGLEFTTDTAEMTENELFQSHYHYLQQLYQDSLVIIDNFNILPKDDDFFREFIKNNFQILITTRCKITSFEALELKELDKEKELTELFFRHCPSAKSEPETTSEIIDVLNAHTLTVCLSALTLEASGMDIEELLYELKTSSICSNISEEVELYKDETFTNARMAEHLQKLLQLSKLDEEKLDILRNLSLLPTSGISKAYLKQWLRLDNLNAVNYLIRYGFITEDTENKRISLHPMIQELSFTETFPSVSSCHTLLNSLHVICLVHGLEVRRPEIVIQSLISVTERIIVDNPRDYLDFLQDLFPYLEKYLVTDYLPKLVERISYMMEQYPLNTICDRALLLDYKAELFVLRKDFDNALKKRKKAIQLMEKLHTPEADVSSASLLSNLYNNLSNTYLYLKQGKDAAQALRTAFDIRIEYAHLGLLESHDTLQQMMNLTNMLLLGKEWEQARQILALYESLVLEYESAECLDYGICQTMYGVLALGERKPIEAEQHLLQAEQIVFSVMGADNDYMKTIYRHLYSLYARWNKPELAEKYKQKLLPIKRS